MVLCHLPHNEDDGPPCLDHHNPRNLRAWEMEMAPYLQSKTQHIWTENGQQVWILFLTESSNLGFAIWRALPRCKESHQTWPASPIAGSRALQLQLQQQHCLHHNRRAHLERGRCCYSFGQRREKQGMPADDHPPCWSEGKERNPTSCCCCSLILFSNKNQSSTNFFFILTSFSVVAERHCKREELSL